MAKKVALLTITRVSRPQKFLLLWSGFLHPKIGNCVALLERAWYNFYNICRDIDLFGPVYGSKY